MTRLHHALLAALACAALFAGCGDDPEPTAAASGPTTSEQADMQDAALKFARCMREHGIDMPDPEFSGGRVRLGGGGKDLDPGSPAFTRAREACQHFLEDARPELSESEKREMQERSLKFVRCLRDHGVDIPDSAVRPDGGLMITPGLGVKPDDPAFERAQEACRAEAPVLRKEQEQ